MLSRSVLLVAIVFISSIWCGLDIFHRGSKITFYPESPADYFGYTVLLTSSSLTVGAPKAASTVQGTLMNPGLVFTCPVGNIDVANTTCQTLKTARVSENVRIQSSIADYTKDDMWFGASIASVHGDLLVCAPRWTSPYRDTHMLANGICYVQTKSKGLVIRPLSEKNRQAFLADGSRKEYGEYGTHLNFYAYGQAGMSVKVTSSNSLIIGAPGLLQWTGGVIEYKFASDPTWTFFSKQPTANPYYTKELGPDDYFGYAVESGIFEPSGKLLYVAAAPRSKMGYGQVLIFEPATREVGSLTIHASIRGPQLGSYFGASLTCADVNSDGRVDLLVGAPNYVAGGELPFDQGAVFVYLNQGTAAGATTGFKLEPGGHVTGSGKNGARFGTSIADLGDVDGDGFRDIAIGAPWEDSGAGAVYVYRGGARGLQSDYSQRITAEGRGFGMAISAGLDLDGNKCNELAIGAHASGTAYIYRCIPTLQVEASIKVPDAMDLPQNATNFTALFCVNVGSSDLWPHVKINLKASITVDPENQRAILSGDDDYTVIGTPGMYSCEEQIVEVKPTADLSKPISLKFVLEVTETMPGTESRLGLQITVINIAEPAYGAKVHVVLPLPPKRVPTPCALKELNLTCNVPAPLPRGAKVNWDIELEYSQNSTEEIALNIFGKLEDPFQSMIKQELTILVKPTAGFNISGNALPNSTVPVSRQKLYEQESIILTHYYEIVNMGPSDWPDLEVEYHIPETLSLTHQMQDCIDNVTKLVCVYSAPANVSLPLVMTLRYNLTEQGSALEEATMVNLTTSLVLPRQNKTTEVRTTLLLDPAPPIWPLIVGLTLGFLVLAAIVYGLHKYGFFSREDHEKLKQLQSGAEAEGSEDHCGSSSTMPLVENDESSQDLLLEDSD